MESEPSLFEGFGHHSTKTNRETEDEKAASDALRTDLENFSKLSQQNQEEVLEDCVVFLFRKICDNGKKTVLIHHAKTERILNFCGPDIVKTIRKGGFNCWIVDRDGMNDECLPLDKALLERMNFISLLIVGPFGLSLDVNQDTLTFKLPFHASGPPEIERSILLHDFFYVPNHRTTDSAFERYKRSVPLPRDQARHRRTFTAVPVGNLKNCRIRKARQAMRPEDRNKILFCAEAYDYANSVVRKHGARLMRGILDRYPENPLVFRPHPVDVDDPITLDILEAFSGEQRFIFDTRKSSEDIMASGCALITDGSVSGLTYCMASSRPAVYFNPFSFAGHFEPSVLGFDFENGKLFRFASSIDEAVDAMEDLVADPGKEFDEIAELSRNAYEHPDDGMEYLLSSIHAIVENRRLPDWKTLELSENEIGNGSAADYAGLIRNNLMNIFQTSSVLSTDLSSLDNEDDATNTIINFFFHVRNTHLHSFRENFDALFSGIEEFGCSITAIKMIGSLIGPILVRGNRDEAGKAVGMLQTIFNKLLQDAREGSDGPHMLEFFQSSPAGAILSKAKELSGLTDPELREMRSYIVELWLTPRVPRGLFSISNIQKNGVCELSLSCRKCGTQKSIRAQFWYSDNVSCESCGTLNHLDPFEKALHLQEAFFARLPAEEKVVLWGAGGFYCKLMQKYNRLCEDIFLLVDADDALQGLSICNKKVHPPDIILHNKIKTVIITALGRKDEICADLRHSYPSIENILIPAVGVMPEGIVPVLKPIEG